MIMYNRVICIVFVLMWCAVAWISLLHRASKAIFWWRKIAIIYLSFSYNMCFGWTKEPSHWDGSFEHPQHMFWLRNKKNSFQLRALIWGLPSNSFLASGDFCRLLMIYLCKHSGPRSDPTQRRAWSGSQLFWHWFYSIQNILKKVMFKKSLQMIKKSWKITQHGKSLVTNVNSLTTSVIYW